MLRVFVLAGSLAILLASCAPKGGDPLRLSKASPIDRPFALKGQKPLDIDALLKALPERMRPTYAKSAFDARLGATIVTGVVFPDPDGAGPRLPMTAQRIELYGVDRDAMRRVSDAARDNVAPFETVFVKIRAFDIAPERRQGDDAAIGALEWSNLRIRRGAFSALQGRAPTAAHFLNNFELDGLYVKNWSAHGPEREPKAAGFNAPDLRIVGLAGGKLEGAVLKGLEYKFAMSPEKRAQFGGGFGLFVGAALNGPLGQFLFPAEQRVTVESLEWRGVDLEGWMRKELAGERIAMDASGLISLGEVRARKVDTYVRDRLASRIDDTAIEMSAFVGVLPAKIVSTAKGATYDFTAYVDQGDDEAVRLLKARGLDKVRGSSRFSWTWDAEKGDAALETNFEAGRVADLDFKLNMSGADAARMEQARQAGEPADFASFAALKAMRIRVDDKAMLDALYALTAARSGETVDRLRLEAPESIRLLTRSARNLDPRAKQVLEAAADFLSDGGTIEITAEPETPVAFSDLGAAGPDALAKSLNLTARHAAPKAKR